MAIQDAFLVCLLIGHVLYVSVRIQLLFENIYIYTKDSVTDLRIESLGLLPFAFKCTIPDFSSGD